ncbi:hypothetical protein G9A89_019947 [Geosiphon pyriformis]|nr:hypothetical protein G9A89_019947 [Geosiphon pyriformis]
MAYAPIVKLEKFTDLCSSILQCVYPMHLADLQAAVTNARDFEAAELEANHTQAVNLNLGTGNSQNPNAQHYLSLLVTPEDTSPNNRELNQHKSLTSNIPPATVTNNESLATIFLFEFKETTPVSLFNRATFDTKLITAMYTNVKIDGYAIKLILDSHRVNHTASACIITTNKTTKTSIGKINNFLFKINGIIIPIKVLNGQHTYVPATCNYFKPIITPIAPLIKFEEEERKPTWEVYQVLWTNEDHNKLPPILSWDDNKKGKQKEKLI